MLAPQQTDVEVVQSSQAENGIPLTEEQEVHDSVLAKHAERSLSFSESGHNRHKELPSSLQDSASLRKPSSGNSNDTVHQPSEQSSTRLSSESSERPRLNLLPRSKPLEKTQSPAGEYKQVYFAPFL